MHTRSPAPLLHVGKTSLQALLSDQVRRRPHEIAVEHVSGQITFAQLASIAASLGARLAGLGARPDSAVGLYAEPSLELVTGVWGILASGAGYLPISPDYPRERIRYMVSDSGIQTIVTQEHLRDQIRELVPESVSIITMGETPGTTAGNEPGGNQQSLSAPCSSSDLAYIIYTSGSTGLPKGVMIEQGSIVSQLHWLAGCGYLSPEVSVLQKTPMSFDAAQWEILAPVMGAKVVVATPGSFRDPEGIIDQIREHQVTTLQGVPTLLQALVDTGRLSACTSLVSIFSGGEALTRTLARDVLDATPMASLVNLYGPTEATINATAYPVDRAELESGDQILPIGTPADRVTCYILDDAMLPVEIGKVGELYIGGAQVGRGYVGMPEETSRRFVTSPFNPTERLYHSGDLASWSPDGTIKFAGRADNQIKLRGYRVELEEITSRIEKHSWVRHAATVVTDDPRTGSKGLLAAVELNERTAAIMDQGRSDAKHHQSKSSKLQVKAQLSNLGLRDVRDDHGAATLEMPGKAGSNSQRSEAFARKTYRYFDGGTVNVRDVLRLLAKRPKPQLTHHAQGPGLEDLGEILRWFGPFRSETRLLPKYTYASPGALYATQMYLEISGVEGVVPGIYYFHPENHTLVQVFSAGEIASEFSVRVHFLGKRSAIEPVYKNNIVEVLEFEAGHILGVFDEVLPAFGLQITDAGYLAEVKERLDVPEEDYYLGSFDISEGETENSGTDDVEFFVQAHGDRVSGLEEGLYRYADGALNRISEKLVERHQVIAINQSVYDRASFGVSAVSRTSQEWLRYIQLGRALHRLQRVPGFGLMSSGYSSKSGNPLPSAVRLDDLLETSGLSPAPASYFFVGGRISEAQAQHEGMNEDAVHTKGPAEIIREDLAEFVPDYMIPARVVVVNSLPTTSNGKIDAKATASLPEVVAAQASAPYVAPSTPTQQWLAKEWGRLLKYEDVSTQDEFFASGGNSLHAVALVGALNREFSLRLPMQVIFEAPKLEDLARRVDDSSGSDVVQEVPDRAILLQGDGEQSPIFCWPGLGGYPLNLQSLAQHAGMDRPFYGIQAYGINVGEEPIATVGDMAAADVRELQRIQPRGPYNLWGYSFGARVAFETAWQLEQLGEDVENLVLICPGNPKLRDADVERWGRRASFANPAYVTILFSVFVGKIHGEQLEECLAVTRDEESFVEFVDHLLPQLGVDTVRRITRIVACTYEFEYSFHELRSRTVHAPITIFKAAGDDYSFLEGASGYSAEPPAVIDLHEDHYGALKAPGATVLASKIRSALGAKD